jgi:hypothetical protein
MGVAPGTAFTGKFVADDGPGAIVETGATGASAGCARDGLTAWTNGRKLAGTAILAEIGGMTFTSGVYTHGTAINIGLAKPIVTLDAQNDPDAVFVFNVGTTLTTCAGSEIKLINGAIPSNVYWVLGTALTMGADSTLIGNVLAGTAVTIGTKGKILGRAMAQTAVTCETGCTVETGPNPACNDPVVVGKYEVLQADGPCFTNYLDPGYDTWSCTSSTASCTTVECVENLVSDEFLKNEILASCEVRKQLIPRQPLL